MGMKLISTEKQTAVSAGSEDASYPATNLINNDKNKKVWKADGVNTATVTLTVDDEGDSTACAIGVTGSNADTIDITVKKPDATTLNTATYTLDATARRYKQCWHEYTTEAGWGQHDIDIDLTAAAGATVEAGIMRAGIVTTLTLNPQYGLKAAPEDYSIVKEYADGSRYIRVRDIVRRYSGNLVLARSSALDLYDIYKDFGPTPVMVLVADGINDLEWTVFGTIEDLGLSHDHPDNSRVSMSILEAI